MPAKNTTDALTLSTLAMSQLGLSKQPFEAQVLSNDGIFTDAIINQLIDTTIHHLQFSDLLLIIEGSHGSGKTTLFRLISQSNISNICLLPVNAEATDTLEQLQQKISLHLKDQGEANKLNDKLKNLQTFDQQPVLIINDAHVLSNITLQELLGYQKQLEKDLQIKLKFLLLANKGMASTLEKISDIQHNQLYVQEMPEYTSKQVQAFIQHKIKIAGYTGESIFENDDIQSIFKKSNGTPLSIMEQTVAHIEKQARKKIKTSGFHLKPAILLVSSIALLCIAGFIKYYLNQIPSVETPTETIPAPVEQTQTKDTIEIEKVISQKKNTIIENKKIESIESHEEPRVKIEAPTETIEDNTSDIKTVQSTAKPNTIKQTEETHNTEVATVAALPTDRPAEEIKTRDFTADKQTEPSITVKEKAAIIETNTLPPSLQQLNQLGLHDKNWIMQQDSNYWSLQITGARDPNTLLYIAKRYKLADNSAWYKTQLTGKPWYVLIYGLYTNKDTANRAKQFLPGDLKSKKPFAKSFNSIQPTIQ